MSEELKPCPLCGKPGIPHARRKHLAHCSDIECFMNYVAIPANEWQKRPIEDALLEVCKAAAEWVGLDGDGISEPVLSQLRSAIDKAIGAQ